MSSPILVDNYYFGHALYHARRRAKLTRDEVTKNTWIVIPSVT